MKEDESRKTGRQRNIEYKVSKEGRIIIDESEKGKKTVVRNLLQDFGDMEGEQTRLEVGWMSRMWKMKVLRKKSPEVVKKERGNQKKTSKMAEAITEEGEGPALSRNSIGCRRGRSRRSKVSTEKQRRRQTNAERKNVSGRRKGRWRRRTRLGKWLRGS